MKIITGKKGLAEKYIAGLVAIGVIVLLGVFMMFMIELATEEGEDFLSSNVKVLEASQTSRSLLDMEVEENYKVYDLIIESYKEDNCEVFKSDFERFLFEEVDPSESTIWLYFIRGYNGYSCDNTGSISNSNLADKGTALLSETPHSRIITEKGDPIVFSAIHLSRDVEDFEHVIDITELSEERGLLFNRMMEWN